MLAVPALAASEASAAPGVLGAYGPVTCTVTISITPSTVGLGATITITISGNCGNDTFTIVLHSSPVTLGTISTNASGSGTGSFTVPTSTSPGTHTITATDPSGNSASATITVTGAAATTATTTSSAALPFTGANAAGTAAIGAGVLCVGGLLVLGARKRRQSRFTG